MIYKHFQCPKCLKTSTAGQWNAETRTLCSTEDLRKHYKSIQQAGQGRRGYKCPACKEGAEIKFIKKLKESEALNDQTIQAIERSK